MGGDYHCAVDMWAVGCIFAELLLGHSLLPGSSDIDQVCVDKKIRCVA